MISWTGSCLEFCGSLTTAVLLQIYGPAIVNERFRWVPMTTLALDVFIDVVNTSALCYYLHTYRTGMKTWVRVTYCLNA